MSTSVLSILSLMFGVFGMCLSCIFIGIFPCVLSVILGCIALKDDMSYKWPSICGIVCSAIGIIMFVVMVSQTNEYKSANVATPTEVVQNLTNTEKESSEKQTTKEENLNNLELFGTWRTENNNGSWMEATIYGDTISIDWVSDNGDTRAIYWIGTYVPPTVNEKKYQWVSERDKEKTDMAIMASTDDTKEFTYSNGQISYEASMLGTTRVMQLEKTDVQSTRNTSDNTITDLNIAESKATRNDEYSIGETWTVEGEWKLTINSVQETQDRNEYSDRNPSAVYIVTFTMENIGYVDIDGYSDGLFLVLDETITDNARVMGYSYPVDVSLYEKVTPVGASCQAQVAIGVDNAGTFKIYVSHYVGDKSRKESATFRIDL